MARAKKQVTNEDLYKKLLEIHKNTKLILARLNRLNKKLDYYDDEHEHDHHHHEQDMPEYKA